jgi:phospholipase C
MGYCDAVDVPVYDHLADNFAICDRTSPRQG